MQHRIKPYEGLFITIEGGEGSGKSTLASQLNHEMSAMGYEVVATREPGGSKLSEHLRNLLLHSDAEMKIGEKAELLLFLAARAQHIEELILPNLRAKKVVICERFNDSTIAYQGCARHLGMGFVEKLCSLAFEDLDPDLTFFLDIDPEVGLARVTDKRKTPLDRVENEKVQFHKEVRQAFLHLADKHPQRMAIIDAALSSKEVLDEAIKILKPHLMLKPSQK